MAKSKTVNNTNIRNMNVVVNNFLFHVHGAAVRAAYAEHDAASDAAFETRRKEIESEAEARRAAADARWVQAARDSVARCEEMERDFNENVARMSEEFEARQRAHRLQHEMRVAEVMRNR
jgi:hypothetical protein